MKLTEKDPGMVFSSGVIHCGFQLEGEPIMSGLIGCFLVKIMDMPVEEEVDYLDTFDGYNCTVVDEDHPAQRVLRAIDWLEEGEPVQFFSYLGYSIGPAPAEKLQEHYVPYYVSPSGFKLWLSMTEQDLKTLTIPYDPQGIR